MKTYWNIALLAGWLGGTALAGAATKDIAPLDMARQLNQAFTEVADQVSQSVVVLKVAQKSSFHDLSDGNPFMDMLPREWRRRFDDQRRERRPSEPQFNGQGSGVIISDEGYILTNNHVVENADKIRVRLHDGREFDATISGTDAQSDLAVVKITAKNLVPAKFGNSSATKVGEFAIAVGAPFDLDYTVTIGHVSAKGRSRIIPDPAMDQDFIQTDANINPGNSGGPLVNINGEVIGINTMIAGMNTGIGFAIPSNLAREVADQLIRNGKYTRSWLGVSITSLKEDPEYRTLVTGVKEGVVVREIMPDGPAAKSDLKPSDVITKVDGNPVTTSQQLRNEIRSKRIGDAVTLDVYRKDKMVQVKVRPEAWPDAPEATPVRRSLSPPADSTKILGMAVQPLNAETTKKFGVKTKSGVVVSELAEDSVAAAKGIKVGDVITEIDHQPVNSLKEFREAVKNADLKKGVVVNLISQETSRFVILKDSGE